MSDSYEIQDPYTLGELRSDLKTIYDRGGDSELDDSIVNRWLNAAEKYLCDRIGVCRFLDISDSMTIPANSTEADMDINIADVYSFRDESNRRPLVFVERNIWNQVIVSQDAGGTPTQWTKFGFTRRTNTGSPASPYGQMKVQFSPYPTSDFTVNYDAQLRPGCMILDSDFPVVPIQYHYGLIEIALKFAGAYDIGSKAYAQHSQLAEEWIRTAVRTERRSLHGNPRFWPREDVNRRSRATDNPLTRRRQLGTS